MDEDFDVILLGTGLTGKNIHYLYSSTSVSFDMWLEGWLAGWSEWTVIVKGSNNVEALKN